VITIDRATAIMYTKAAVVLDIEKNRTIMTLLNGELHTMVPGNVLVVVDGRRHGSLPVAAR